MCLTSNSKPVALLATSVARLDHFNFCPSPSIQAKEGHLFFGQNMSDFATEGGNMPPFSFEYWTFFKQTYCDTDQTIDKHKLRVFVDRKKYAAGLTLALAMLFLTSCPVLLLCQSLRWETVNRAQNH